MNTPITELSNDAQNPKRINKVIDQLNTILMTGEEIEYISIQKKLINLLPNSLALTSKRIILCRPKNFGFAMEFQDYLWKDVLKCHFQEGFFGATFTIETTNGEMKVKYLPKAQARKLYAISQEQEEKQSSLRRQSELEDKRASASNVTIAPSRNQSEKEKQESPVIALQNLKTLLENGDLTKLEFENKKIEILSRI